MNRVLSDEELRVEVDGILNTLGETFDISSAARDVVELINTQKRLYAKSVIGEDEDALKTLTSAAINIATGRNELRSEQRARIK